MIRTETDSQECRKLWDAFSPHQDAWDDWDLMFAFHDQDTQRFNFLVHQDSDGRPDGLVPLVHDSRRDRFTLLAGSYPDGRILWLAYEDFPEFFEHFPEQTVLFDLKESWVSGLLERCPQFEANVSERELRYYLVPPEFDFDFHNHLDTFPSGKKQKFLYDLRSIRKRGPTLS
ncbi:MAG: hypothetical protein KJO82_06240, partial [Gammaproteobacteria bacterium]|nr:hypothetical protein [Gammaproteobacteria bacterium]